MTSVRSVLICDEEPSARLSLKTKLQELGFDAILECGDGESAVALVLAALPDIAILNACLPEKDGMTAAREIRQKLKIPVILLTACCNPETVKKAKKIGISALLSKPFRGQDLLPAIVMALANAVEVAELKGKVAELKETIESMDIVDKAKEHLMGAKGLSEKEAFRKIQKLAMEKQKSMRWIAEAILITEGV